MALILKNNTLIVNLFGGPASGKSTVAAGLFCLLKMHNIRCEFVTEFAKDLVWEERYKTLKNQQYIFGKQYHKIWRVLNQVDVIITDSPLLLSTIYMPENYPDSFVKNVIDTINTLNNLNILLNRQKEYNNDGRYQTEEQAKIIDKDIKQKLFLYDMRWVEFYADFNSINKIVQLILTKIDGSEFNRSDLNFYIETNL
jgi:nicotinamide riboside kinase